MIFVRIALLAVALLPHPHARKPHKHHRHPRVYTANATSYCQGGTTADGSQAAPGEVASNEWPLETRIRTRHPIFGRTLFVVRDRIGWGSELDVFTPDCSQALGFGRQTVAYVVTR